jgi:hypothetical protein
LSSLWNRRIISKLRRAFGATVSPEPLRVSVAQVGRARHKAAENARLSATGFTCTGRRNRYRRVARVAPCGIARHESASIEVL